MSESKISKAQIFQIFQDVISNEAEALKSLVASIDDRCTQAAEMIFNSKRKVITIGVGKSGFVARKVASTLSSTGTLAIFVHPTEASHGDLGMIGEGDTVLAFSKSGESHEINSLLPALRSLGAQVIAITAKENSTLAQSATLVLPATVPAEACPLDLAPTSSVIAAVALGDALAMALMRMRGFKENDFAIRHPGGQIGRRLHLKVRDRLVPLERCHPLNIKNANLNSVLETLGRNMLGVVLITNDKQELVAIVTDGDVRRALNQHKENIFKMDLSEFWKTNPITLSPDLTAAEAISFMENREKPLNIVVVTQGTLVMGVARLHDFLG